MSAVMEEKTFRGLREVAVLSFFASALFLLISLVTFSIEDAGWTHSGTALTVTNACGVIGAWIADISLSFFGLTAYLFPVIIAWRSYLLHKRIKHNKEKSIITALGLIAFITAGSALLHLYMLRVNIELPRDTGGILGEETGETAFNLLGNSGATLFLIVLLLAGITLATELSWVALVDVIGKHTVSACHNAWHYLARLSQQRAVLPIQLPVQSPFHSPKKTESLKKPVPPKAPDAVAQKQDKPVKPGLKKQAPVYDASKGVLPDLDLLDNRESRVAGYSQSDLEAMSRMVEEILADFNVAVTVVGFHPGPVITRFELQPAAGVKVSRISTLSKDLARALLVTSVRIVEIIPGKSVVGLEIPNREREMVICVNYWSPACLPNQNPC